MELKSMIWKELKDLSRDRKTLLTAVVLPAIMLPLMAQLLVLAQKSTPVRLVIINEDQGAQVPTLFFQPLPFLQGKEVQRVNLGLEVAKIIERAVKRVAPNTKVIILNGSVKELPKYDVLVIIPKDFSEKLLTLDPTEFNVTYVSVFYRAAPSSLGISATQVYQTVVTTLNMVSRQYFAKERVSVLLACCNATQVKPEYVLNPIIVKTQYVSVTGKRISAAELGKMLSAKLLLFSIFYVSVPVLAFISDSIAGEKERKTLETLLASPISRKNIVLGKFAASLVLGLLAAMADVVGLIFYIQTINSQIAASATAQAVPGLTLTLDPKIVALHAFIMLLVVASTAALLMPIVSLTDSVRSAQSIGGFIQMLPLLVILYAMYSDINALPLSIKIMVYAIPHTYAVLAIDQALKGSWVGVLESLLAMVAITGALLAVTIRIFESEILITGLPSLSKKRSS